MEHKFEKRICQNYKKDFIIEPDDFSFYEKIKVPPPTFCPECRMTRRMIWRNERSLYKRNCDYNGISMITMFHPDSNVKVYNRKIWWSDKWDPTDYGQDYDFSKSFFEQYKELLSKVPLANVGNTNVENSPYSNHIANAKNCYLVYGSFESEDIAYSQGALYSKNCMDTYSVQKCEQCYEDILCDSMFQTHFSYDSDQSLNSFFLNKCVNCNDCISCINLRNKKYCIFNKQYTKEEYLKKKEKLDFGSYKILSNFKKEYKDFILRNPHKYASILKSLNVTGDNIMNSKNIKYSFDIFREVED